MSLDFFTRDWFELDFKMFSDFFHTLGSLEIDSPNCSINSIIGKTQYNFFFLILI